MTRNPKPFPPRSSHPPRGLTRRPRLTCALGPSVLASVLAACTVSHYEITGPELERIARVDPAERGARVRALQQTVYDQDDLGGAELQEAHTTSNATLLLMGNETRRRRPPPRTRDRDDDDDPGSLAAAAALALVATGVVLIPLAITEATRHDGWVQLPDDQPLYLVGPDRWVSLENLTPEDVAATRRAVAPAWSGQVEPLERRPLDRVGLAYTLELGVARLPRSEPAPILGYGGRLSLGGHPIDSLGLFVGGQFAYGTGPLEGPGGQAGTFLGKVFGAVEFLPATLGIFHAGFYAEGGVSRLVQGEEPRSASAPYVGLGPLFQLALSTRLALGLRVGATQLAASGRSPIPEIAFGVAVY